MQKNGSGISQADDDGGADDLHTVRFDDELVRLIQDKREDADIEDEPDIIVCRTQTVQRFQCNPP